MKQMVNLLGWLGVALVAGALVLRFVPPGNPQWSRYLALAGLVVVAIYAASQWREIQRSFQGRNAKYGSMAFGSIVLFLAILVGVNWVSNRQNKRWDLTANREFTLSEQTQQILAGLQSPLHIRVFHDQAADTRTYREQLEQYEYHSSQVSTEYINVQARPTEAERFEITAAPTFVLEFEGRTQRATSASEQAMANALKKVLEGSTKKAYFTQGHGERDPNDTNAPGYKAASGALVDENFEVLPLTIAQAGAIPADATVLIVAGPTRDFLSQEVDLIREYLTRGGKLLLMIDPPAKGEASAQPTSLIALAKDWGIEVGNDIVVDASGLGQLLGTDASVPIGMPTQHPITEGFRVMTAFPLARSVKPVEGGADGKVAQNVIQTGEQSWAESDVAGLYATGRPTRDLAKGDTAGPVPVAAAVSAPVTTPTPAPDAEAAPDNAPKPESRLVVIGDSDFATNRWASPQLGNMDLFLNSVNWLAQQEDLIAIRPRDPEDRRIALTNGQRTALFWITLLVIPGLLFANAWRVYWKRR